MPMPRNIHFHYGEILKNTLSKNAINASQLEFKTHTAGKSVVWSASVDVRRIKGAFVMGRKIHGIASMDGTVKMYDKSGELVTLPR